MAETAPEPGGRFYRVTRNHLSFFFSGAYYGHFLTRTLRGLSKGKLGEYLGEKDQFCQDVLKEFVRELDFSPCDTFDKALR